MPKARRSHFFVQVRIDDRRERRLSIILIVNSIM